MVAGIIVAVSAAMVADPYDAAARLWPLLYVGVGLLGAAIPWGIAEALGRLEAIERRFGLAPEARPAPPTRAAPAKS